MRKLLLLPLLFVAACRTAEVPTPTRAEATLPTWREENTPAPKQVANETAKKGLISKMFGPGKPETQIPSGLKKCKNCTFLAPGATATTIGKKATAATAAGATAIGKAKGQTVTGDSATALDQSDAAGAVNINGDGNSPKVSATQEEALSPWAVLVDNLSSPVGYVLGGLLLVGLVYGVIRYRSARKLKDTLLS